MTNEKRALIVDAFVVAAVPAMSEALEVNENVVHHADSRGEVVYPG